MKELKRTLYVCDYLQSTFSNATKHVRSIKSSYRIKVTWMKAANLRDLVLVGYVKGSKSCNRALSITSVLHKRIASHERVARNKNPDSKSLMDTCSL